ncbi:DNA gyrase inhibitor YacG [Salipiger sp. IMCC34102]|uniref:DNA gyrase inhibitor YacG n=1 Tax=Salipiger sp. IMCC34102 TaxID=2510647 RepID=UPI00101E205C|nr:DNA gyrase inhibitor YacG [Salipiger sp. IMCC34102]RYH02744.1 DNA gyrase inhibitor YacG [Salipiger sp. IMCC34102]
MSCPICDRETDPKFRPFCSKRCADIDLARWLSGSYAIPAGVEEQGDDDPVEGFGEGSEKPH